MEADGQDGLKVGRALAAFKRTRDGEETGVGLGKSAECETAGGCVTLLWAETTRADRMRPSTHRRDEGFPDIEVSLYCITNTVNGKRYIGITYIPLEKRWKQHLYEAFGLESQRALYCAIRKYGSESFTVELLELLNDWGEAGEREKHYIRQFNTMCNGGHGYNMTAGADGVLGVPPPPEAVERAKEAIWRRAADRAERLRPSVEELMADGFLNFREFAGRMNRAGIPTLKGGARWGIGNVKAVLERLGYDMPLLERKALEDKIHARNVVAMPKRPTNVLP